MSEPHKGWMLFAEGRFPLYAFAHSRNALWEMLDQKEKDHVYDGDYTIEKVEVRRVKYFTRKVAPQERKD